MAEIPDLATKLAQIRTLAGQVTMSKTAPSEFGGWGFATEEDILDVVRPLMDNIGVTIVPSVLSSEQRPMKYPNGKDGLHTTIECEFRILNCGRPEEREVVRWCAESDDTHDHGISQAMTSAHRAFLSKLFALKFVKKKGGNGKGAPPAGSGRRRGKSQSAVGQVLDLCKKYPDGENAAYAWLQEVYGTRMVTKLSADDLRDAHKRIKKRVLEFEAAAEQMDRAQGSDDREDGFIEGLDGDQG